MRGVGGPLLTISDLLSDVGEENTAHPEDRAPLEGPDEVPYMPATDLPKLFQENFDQLRGALDGADHSWTALTLKLCSSLETANKLVDSVNSHAASLTEQVQKLEQIVDRRDSAVAAAKAIQGSPKM